MPCIPCSGAISRRSGTPGAGQVLRTQLERDFAGLDAFRDLFRAAGEGVQGSGWAVLCWELLASPLIVQQVLDHQHNPAFAAVPILAMDMWEHAFYLQYRSDKRAWISAFWELVNWRDVEQRLRAARERPAV